MVLLVNTHHFHACSKSIRYLIELVFDMFQMIDGGLLLCIWYATFSDLCVTYKALFHLDFSWIKA